MGTSIYTEELPLIRPFDYALLTRVEATDVGIAHKGGDEVGGRITAARRRLLSRALADWSAQDVRLLAELTARLATALGGPGDDAPPLPGQRPA